MYFPQQVRVNGFSSNKKTSLLERNEPGRVGGSDTGTTVLDGLVSDGELAKVMADHLWLDFHLGEGLAVVHAHNGAGHLGHDDHVTEVGLDGVGLLVGRSFLLLLAQLLDEGHRLPLQSAVELPPHAARKQLHQLLVAHVQELVQIHTAVGVLPESTLLLQLCGLKKSHQKCQTSSSNIPFIPPRRNRNIVRNDSRTSRKAD